MKESEVSFPNPGQGKGGGRGTFPNPISSGVEELPALSGSVGSVFSTAIEVNDYQVDLPDNGDSVVFNVNDYTEDRSFIINRGMEIRGAASSDHVAQTATIQARFASFGNPLTQVVIVHARHNPFGAALNRTLYFTIATFL